MILALYVVGLGMAAFGFWLSASPRLRPSRDMVVLGCTT